MAQKERADIYTIPPNFAKEGTILSGRVEARNAVEATILVLFLLQILMKINLSVKGRIYVGIIVILPLAILAVIGVQGESLSSFIFQFFCYLTKRRTLTVPSGQYRLKRNRRMRKRQKKQNREQQKKEGGGKHRKRSRRVKGKAQRGKACREKRAERSKTEAESRTGEAAD